MVTKHGDSCFYIFTEADYETNSDPYFKIGIVLHSTTDEGVKNWEKYVLSPHPISITRRLAKCVPARNHESNRLNTKQGRRSSPAPLSFYQFR